MSVGVESRSPFFDHRLAEAALALRPGELLRDGVLKWPLRAAMRGLVPDAIVDRRDKQGFSVDQNEWITGRLGVVIDETFADPETAARGYVRVPELRALLADVRAGARGIDELWRAFITERWLRLFIDPECPRAAGRCAPARRLGRAEDRVTRLVGDAATCRGIGLAAEPAAGAIDDGSSMTAQIVRSILGSLRTGPAAALMRNAARIAIDHMMIRR